MHRIFVMLPNNLGDVIMTLPVLQALKTRLPESHITFLAESGYEGGLVNSRYCDRILLMPRKAVKAATASEKWHEAPELLREIIDEVKGPGCDVVINLSQHGYCSFIATLVGAREVYGRRFLREGNHALDDPWSRYLYAIPFSRSSNALHATDVYCRIAGVVSRGNGENTISLTHDELGWGIEYLKKNGCANDGKVAILQPGAAYASKRWPPERFIALGKKLAADGYYIVITGAPAERAGAAVIAENIGVRCLSTAGELTFRETIVLCAFCAFVVCGDTALMHAAAALGKRVCALFGPTSPVETGPYGAGHHVCAGNCAMRPCFRTDCGTLACMRSISPETVYECIRGLPVVDRGCTVFTTRFCSETWQCATMDNRPNPYYDAAAAWLTRKAFDPQYRESCVQTADTTAVEASITFVTRCMEMEQTLVALRNSGNSALLQRFEQLRKNATAESGIAAFWNAVLNLRLNSVPLLDPVAGLEESIAACRATHRQITGCLSS
jgi:ADP-heptose:LPS heptosyltransferase